MIGSRVGGYKRLYAAYILRIAFPWEPDLLQYKIDGINANTYYRSRVGTYKRIYAAYIRRVG